MRASKTYIECQENIIKEESLGEDEYFEPPYNELNNELNIREE